MKCSYYNECEHVEQQKFNGNLLIAPHNLLFNNQIHSIDGSQQRIPKTVIVDESFIGKVENHCTISIKDIEKRLLSSNISHTESDILKSVLDGRNGNTFKLLRDKGIDSKAIESVLEKLKKCFNSFTYNPDSNVLEFPIPLHLSTLYDCLCKELKTGRENCQCIKYEKKFIEVYFRNEVKRYPKDTKYLFLDANSHPMLVEKGFGLKPSEYDYINNIHVKRNAFITQIYDQSFPKSSFRPEELAKKNFYRYNKKAPENIQNIDKFIWNIASKHSRVLVVFYKDFIELLNKPQNVDFMWWNGLRGIDKFKDHDAAILIGRNQPPLSVLEDTARSIFYDDEKPLNFMNRDNWIFKMGAIRLKSGGYYPVEVQSHIDERMNVLLEQQREYEIVQGMNRILRDIEPTFKKIYILTNIPIPVPVDRICTFQELLNETSIHHTMFEPLNVASDIAIVDCNHWLNKCKEVLDSKNIKYSKNDFENNILKLKDQELLDYSISSIINRRPTCLNNIVKLKLISIFHFHITNQRGGKNGLRRCISIHDEETTSRYLEEYYGKKVTIKSRLQGSKIFEHYC